MTRLARLGSDFDEFVRQSSVDLLRLAVLLTRDSGEAQDLVQVALVRVAGRWSAARRNPRPYTRRVLVNLAKNRWRDKSRRPYELRDLVGVEPAEDSADDHIVQRDAVSRLMAQLPMGQRKVLVLRYFEDLSVAEVAAILGCSDGNVKSQSNRALATLREKLAAQAGRPATEALHAQR
jgi:RNA polymerase sigma-70 factor (sigma-E family)